MSQPLTNMENQSNSVKVIIDFNVLLDTLLPGRIFPYFECTPEFASTLKQQVGDLITIETTWNNRTLVWLPERYMQWQESLKLYKEYNKTNGCQAQEDTAPTTPTKLTPKKFKKKLSSLWEMP